MVYNDGKFCRRRWGKLPSVRQSDLLLFCVESAGGRHVAYFVERATLKEDVPTLFRYACTKRLFGGLILGGLYSLRVSKRRILAAELVGEYDIDDGYFSLLLELKSIRFRRGERLDAFDPDRYYSFFELRALVEYKERWCDRALNGLIRAALHLPAIALPPVAYVLLLVALLKQSGSPAAPLLLLLALPAMVFALAAGYQLCELLLLKLPRTRYGMLRAFTLRNGGARLALKLSREVKQRMLALGGVAAISLFVGVALLFVL